MSNYATDPVAIASNENDNCCIIVLGASGDLAFKKTYPALFGLYKSNNLPKNTQIIGYARSKYSIQDFKKRISSTFKITTELEKSTLDRFLDLCSYTSGQYDQDESFKNLNSFVESVEGDVKGARDRVFYMALPPSVFITSSAGIRDFVYSKTGINRIIVEKPFGKDLDSSRVLADALQSKWDEDEVYRIDHYLGKEMVKNIMVLRFANTLFSAIWNRQHIHNIQITFKETIGTDGRGGYFDEFGIIRDIMQNHLLQVLSVIAMDKPCDLNANSVRNEKVKVLKSIKPLTVNDILIGQYVSDGTVPGYLDDKTVPSGSVCPTFAAATLFINNDRWNGVPFIMKAGKALNESKVEVRIQFRDVCGDLYPESGRNELVIRIQPQEAIYMKFMNKEPGLSYKPIISELDLSYSQRYPGFKIPEAYESLILDALKGEKFNFVRNDELDAAWKIFTPLLHHLAENKVASLSYKYGTRGPDALNSFVEKYGYVRQPEYKWSKI